MKKILYIGLIISSVVFANSIKIIPMSKALLSSENGGTLKAIDAYQDGVGIFTSGLANIDNGAMNELVYKYGEESKLNNSSLKDFVLNTANNNTDKELANLLGQLAENNFKLGDMCDDGNSNTGNDTIIDDIGTCKGTRIYNSVKCLNEAIGSSILVDSISYLVVDNTTIKSNLGRAETLCTSNVKDMSYLFYSSTFNGNITNWDVSSVRDMSWMFYNSSFNGDISNWDVSSVINMSYVFRNSQFNGNISEWDVSKVKNMYQLFTYSQFNGNISNWNVGQVTNMSYIFTFSKFNGNISNWNVSSVTNMEYMFYNSNFNSNISGWCVSKILAEPTDFKTGSLLSVSNTPIWGTCVL